MIAAPDPNVSKSRLKALLTPSTLKSMYFSPMSMTGKHNSSMASPPTLLENLTSNTTSTSFRRSTTSSTLNSVSVMSTNELHTATSFEALALRKLDNTFIPIPATTPKILARAPGELGKNTLMLIGFVE